MAEREHLTDAEYIAKLNDECMQLQRNGLRLYYQLDDMDFLRRAEGSGKEAARLRSDFLTALSAYSSYVTTMHHYNNDRGY